MTYLMESADEAARLEAKTLRSETLAQLSLVGLGPGMRALDAGAGTGAVARVITEVVGDSGEVVALDASPARVEEGRRLAEASGANVRFVVGDLMSPPPELGAGFDFVWSRFLFEYLADPDAALGALIDLARPGGRIVVGDLDGNAIFHHPYPARLAAPLETLVAALEQDGRFDPLAGRKLYGRFRRAGLTDIRVHILPYHNHAGTVVGRDLDNWTQKLATIRVAGEPALGGRIAYDAFCRAFLEHLRDPDTLTYSVLFLVEAQKGSRQ